LRDVPDESGQSPLNQSGSGLRFPSGAPVIQRVHLYHYQKILERETRLEIATSSLARLRFNVPKALIQKRIVHIMDRSRALETRN
jgi:hypothetical protein